MTAKQGNVFMLASALLFSLGGVCMKSISWGGLAVNGPRTLISGLMLLAYLKIKKEPIVISRGTILGGFCVFATTTLYCYANIFTTAANAILIQFVAPVFIILLMWLFFGEKPKRLDVITCILVFGGIACFVLDGLGGGGMLGNLLALLPGLTYAGVFMMKKLPGGDPFSAAMLGQLTAGIVGTPFVRSEPDFRLKTLVFMAVLGVF